MLVLKIPTSVDLVLVYLHYKSEMHHCSYVLTVYEGRVPEFIVECLPCAERLAGGAAYDKDGFLVLEQLSRSGALLRSIEIPRLAVVRVDGGEVEGDPRLEYSTTSHNACDSRW